MIDKEINKEIIAKSFLVNSEFEYFMRYCDVDDLIFIINNSKCKYIKAYATHVISLDDENFRYAIEFITKDDTSRMKLVNLFLPIANKRDCQYIITFVKDEKIKKLFEDKMNKLTLR